MLPDWLKDLTLFIKSGAINKNSGKGIACCDKERECNYVAIMRTGYIKVHVTGVCIL